MKPFTIQRLNIKNNNYKPKHLFLIYTVICKVHQEKINMLRTLSNHILVRQIYRMKRFTLTFTQEMKWRQNYLLIYITIPLSWVNSHFNGGVGNIGGAYCALYTSVVRPQCIKLPQVRRPRGWYQLSLMLMVPHSMPQTPCAFHLYLLFISYSFPKGNFPWVYLIGSKGNSNAHRLLGMG